MKLNTILTTASALLLLAGCNGSKKHVEALASNPWRLEQVIFDDSAYSDTIPAGVTLLFSDSSTIAGNGGCNSFFGVYTTAGKDQIDIEVKGSTMAFCPDLDFEARYFDMLSLVSSYAINGDEMQLDAPENGFTMIFKADQKQ